VVEPEIFMKQFQESMIQRIIMIMTI